MDAVMASSAADDISRCRWRPSRTSFDFPLPSAVFVLKPRSDVSFGQQEVLSPAKIKPRTKAIFVSHFAPVVQEDIVSYINQELKVSNLKVAKLKTKYDSYFSFHVAVDESDFE
ncbi:hypothetical protein PR048_001207 [Dryococelus australis]|uniref:Uncharacterized protein n=1 Tax=Dryococelus australis TaxID=614101 RepID=A0ABQ9IHE0_9NEOP|nr:hypothetical protein PR048_001207 [Dryococelus australis]